jgi:hypothetical protein
MVNISFVKKITVNRLLTGFKQKIFATNRIKYESVFNEYCPGRTDLQPLRRRLLAGARHIPPPEDFYRAVADTGRWDIGRRGGRGAVGVLYFPHYADHPAWSSISSPRWRSACRVPIDVAPLMAAHEKPLKKGPKRSGNGEEICAVLNVCGKAALTIAALDWRRFIRAETSKWRPTRNYRLQHHRPRVQQGGGAASSVAPARSPA